MDLDYEGSLAMPKFFKGKLRQQLVKKLEREKHYTVILDDDKGDLDLSAQI